uniref:Mitochondrial fission 1 protein n=1 Tax=Ditylenchus dipsaci TaxID=166011 RepID=A0A915ESF9_9BILA
MDIGSVVDEYIDSADLERFRKAYEDQLNRGVPSAMTVFNYAHALIKSTKEDVILLRADSLTFIPMLLVRIGIFLLEGLLKRDTEDIPKRDYVYYLAIALTRIKDYDRALAYIDTLLAAESDNRQALDLKDLIQKRMKRDGLLGLAVLG